MNEENTNSNESTIPRSLGRKISIANLPAIPVIGIIIGILVLIVVVAFFLGNKPDPKVVKLVESGNAALKTSDYTKAQEEFKKALEIQNTNPAAQTGLINSYSLQGNQEGTEEEILQKSKPIIEQALKAHPNDTDLLIAAGYAYETAGDYENANEYFKKATQVSPGSSEAWFHLGHVNQFLGNADDAKKYYDKAYELDPKNPLVNIMRANTFFSQGDPDQAFKSFQTAANNTEIPDSVRAEALTGAAIVMLNRDNFKYIAQADAIAKQAVAADSNFAPALGIYATTQSLLGQTDTAITYFTRAIEANPRISKNYYMLGVILRSEKDYEAAISNLESAIVAVDNDNTIFTTQSKNVSKGTYYYDLAKTYNLAGAPTDTIMQSLQKALELNPNLKPRLEIEATNTTDFSRVASNPAFQSLIN